MTRRNDARRKARLKKIKPTSTIRIIKAPKAGE